MLPNGGLKKCAGVRLSAGKLELIALPSAPIGCHGSVVAFPFVLKFIIINPKRDYELGEPIVFKTTSTKIKDANERHRR